MALHDMVCNTDENGVIINQENYDKAKYAIDNHVNRLLELQGIFENSVVMLDYGQDGFLSQFNDYTDKGGALK
jgi:hypothetical protein